MLAYLGLGSTTASARDITLYDASIIDYERAGLAEIEEAKAGLKACKTSYDCRIEFQNRIYLAYGELLISRYSHFEKPVASELFRYLQNVREMFKASKSTCSTSFGVLPIRNNECYSKALANVIVVFEHAYFNELERN